MLRDTRRLPPGGWIYTQKETGWALRDMSPFQDAVQKIALHRKANNLPRSALEQASEDLQAATCERLGNDPTFCVSQDVKKNFSQLLRGAPSHVRNLAKAAVDSVSTLANGAGILFDWLGDGMRPVDNGLSQSRSDICTGRLSGAPCPYNSSSQSLAPFIAPVAGFIREQMQKRQELGISVEGEESLHTCALCLCDLKLKIHVPLATIVERTPDAMISKFRDQQPKCWLIQELDKQNNNPT